MELGHATLEDGSRSRVTLRRQLAALDVRHLAREVRPGADERARLEFVARRVRATTAAVYDLLPERPVLRAFVVFGHPGREGLS